MTYVFRCYPRPYGQQEIDSCVLRIITNYRGLMFDFNTACACPAVCFPGTAAVDQSEVTALWE